MTPSSTRLTRLPNGVRIASIEMPHMKTVSAGVWETVGSRHEPESLGGISHFLEHLMFKGTRRRSARKITETVESLGGYLNAFTTEDHTCYYAKAPAAHLPILCDVLADMVLESQFPKTEIERERKVIREEILMVRDNPGQYVEELLSEALWPGHPLGRPLTGTLESIAGLDRDQFLDYKERHYVGKTTIVTVAGAAAHERVLELLAPAMGSLPPGRLSRFRPASASPRPQIKTVDSDDEQTNLALGFHTFGRCDERRFALRLLSVILGENMSSRLFQRLRERNGMCYSIQTTVVSLEDAGALTIFAALEPSKLEKAVRLTLEELGRIAAEAPKAAELCKARDYLLGQTLMGLESTSNQMTWAGESLMSFGRVVDPAEAEANFRAVTPEQVRSVAAECLQRSRLGCAVTGPKPDAAKLAAWLEA